MRTARQQYFIQRLQANLASAEVTYAKVEERVLAAREQGVDTSTFDPRTSATSADSALLRAQGQVEQARKALSRYLAKTSNHPASQSQEN